ncbi:MAG: FecR family protein [Flavobacteriaceae bacterium]|nr:FecR family protein [Flavobacteriaceae bacterium]
MDKDYLIKKWLVDELTDAETEAFKKLDDHQLSVDIIDHAKQFKASHFSNIDDFEVFKQKYQVQKNPIHKLNWLNPLLRIASVVVIAFGIYFSFFYNNLTQIQTLASQKTTIELPDHSKVMLNALSKVEYNKRDWANQRELKLQGEAYFKVAKGKKFDVITKDGVVTVVGTQFNVKQRKNYFEVKCFEGIVKVSSIFKTKLLHVGDTYLILNGKFKEGETSLIKPNWTDNKSSFKAVPVKEVLAELERQYNIKITFKNINTNRLFTGGFTHDNLENALNSITQPMNMTYDMSSSNLVIIHEKKN